MLYEVVITNWKASDYMVRKQNNNILMHYKKFHDLLENEWYASKLSFPALVRQSDHFVVPLLSLRLEIVTPGQAADPGGFASAAAPRGGVSPHTFPALSR
jgi:hypothetical protein